MKCRFGLVLALGLCLLQSGTALGEPTQPNLDPLHDKDPLVDVLKEIPDVVLDVRYATADNFLKAPVYPMVRVLLRQSTSAKLKIAQEEFKKLGYRIKIFDGYRPLAVQKKMWAIKPDARYVANPKSGSMHNRAGAVDISLVTIEGKDVTMPTPYDDFSEKAHHGAAGIPTNAASNAKLLKSVMEKSGFQAIGTEWWHYQDPKIRSFPVLDVPFDSI